MGLEGIAGQEEAKRLFARAASAARREGKTVPHCLIDGPAGTSSGLGESSLMQLGIRELSGLREVIEPPLLRLGLMTTTVRGRAALPETARLLHVRTRTGMGREAATA